MNIKKKIKEIVIILSVPVIMIELTTFLAMSLIVPAVPDENLEKAIEFLQEDNYIGMTVEECEMLLGEEAHKYSDKEVFIDAGTYRYEKVVDYILVLYLNDEGKVMYARLEGIA